MKSIKDSIVELDINPLLKLVSVMKIIIVTLVVASFSGVTLAWDVYQSKDEMTGEVQAYASSERVTATKFLPFPYTDLKSWLGFGCNKNSEWVYVGFSVSPNLNNDQTEDGYNVIKTRVKWDDNIVKQEFTQEWGSKFLHSRDNNATIQNYIENSLMLLELNWHGAGIIYFKYSLVDSVQAIQKARDICKTR